MFGISDPQAPAPGCTPPSTNVPTKKCLHIPRCVYRGDTALGGGEVGGYGEPPILSYLHFSKLTFFTFTSKPLSLLMWNYHAQEAPIHTLSST